MKILKYILKFHILNQREKVGGLRLHVIRSSVLETHVSPLLIAILILSGTVSATSMPLATHAQSDSDYDSGAVSSDVSTYNDLGMDEGQNGDEGSSDASDSNDGMVDFSQVSTDETPIDNGVDSAQDNTDTSGGDNLPADGTQDSAPIADAGQDLEVYEINEVALDGSASVDEDGEISSYSWEQVDGFPIVELNSADSVQPSFIAPDVDSNQELTFQLSVTDNDGLIDTDSVNVLVIGITPPEVPEDKVKPVPDEQVTEPNLPLEVPDANVTNCIGNETDCEPAGQEPPIIDPCLANQTEIGCEPAGQEPPVILQTPKCPEGNITELGCEPPKEEPPVIDACPGGNTTELGCVPLSATPECPGGNMTEAGCITPVESPECPGGNMTGNITGCTPPEGNIGPVADAGENQIVDEDSAVTSDGRGSYDIDGNITSYTWIQASGNPSFTISDADSPSANFIAPHVDNDTNFRIKLTVTDDNDASNSDYVDILIRDTNDTIIPELEGELTLDEIPNQISAGSIFVFSGRFEITGANLYNSSNIQIKSISNDSDADILGFNTVDSDGRYVVEWTAVPKEMPYEVQAMYEDDYGRILRSETQSFQVIENRSEILTESESVINGPYIPLVFNDYNKEKLNVYVQYDEGSTPYVSVAVNAIKHWSKVLQESSGNPNAWKFNIFTGRDFPNADASVNILVNLKLENNRECPGWSGGCAHNNWIGRVWNGKLVIYVYTGSGSQNRISYITSHEFGHALGLGHTWNEGNKADGSADMMCSLDYRSKFLGILPIGETIETCQMPTDVYHDRGKPSEFNVRAVRYNYQDDGFQAPNLKLHGNDIYVCQPLPCEPPYKTINVEQPKSAFVKSTINQPNTKNKLSPTDDNRQINKKTFTTTATTSDTTTTNQVASPITIRPTQAQSITLIDAWNNPGESYQRFNHPASIASDGKGQRIYVADLDNNKIVVLHKGGDYDASWGTSGKGPGQFNGPGSVAVDDKKKVVFVADIGNNRIQKFDTQGNFIKEWGRLGSGDGQFDHPGDIALDSDKEILYVTDIYNNRIQEFYYDGNFVTSWGSFGTGDGQFNRPAGITINPNDETVYVSDTANNRIQVFDGDGNFRKKWGSLGTANGDFARPDGIHFDTSDNSIYVADRQNHRIQVFDAEGEFITKWTTSSAEPIKPRDIELDLSGQIYVVDKTNSNVLVYQFSGANPSTELKVEKQNTKVSSTSSSSSGQDSRQEPQKSKGEISVNIKVAKETITRGNVQTITVEATDSVTDKPIKNAQVEGSVSYVTGHIEDFSGKTDSSGKSEHSWRISGNASPGDFDVDVDVSASGYDDASESDSFEVQPKS